MARGNPTASDARHGRLHRLATALQELGGARDVDETLQLMVDLATEVVRAVDVADVMFVRDGDVTTPVASHELAIEVDRIQQETGEGPCLSASREEHVVFSRDLEQEDRWPRFTRRALDLGVRSVAAHRLFDERDGTHLMGALNLFGTRPGIDEVDVELAGVFAAHCSAVLADAMEEEGLQAALSAREVIGQAKGILMERHDASPEEAHAMLRRTAAGRGVEVSHLARTVTETGALP